MWIAWIAAAAAMPLEGLEKGITIRFSTEGAQLCAAVDRARVRGTPEEKGQELGTLSLGTCPQRRQMPDVDGVVGERQGRWLAVSHEGKPGWIWSGTLGPPPLKADLDGDGHAELITAAYAPDHRLLVRVADGKPASEEQRVSWVDLGVQQDMGGFLDEATLQLVPAAKAGLPLLQVHVPGSEQCGGYSSTTWLAVARLPEGGQRLVGGLSTTNGGDAPVYMHEEVRFEPSTRTAVLTRISGEYMDSGEDHQEVNTSTLRWTGQAWETTSSKDEKRVLRPPAQP
jgi:hypothetical protein